MDTDRLILLLDAMRGKFRLSGDLEAEFVLQEAIDQLGGLNERS